METMRRESPTAPFPQGHTKPGRIAHGRRGKRGIIQTLAEFRFGVAAAARRGPCRRRDVRRPYLRARVPDHSCHRSRGSRMPPRGPSGSNRRGPSPLPPFAPVPAPPLRVLRLLAANREIAAMRRRAGSPRGRRGSRQDPSVRSARVSAISVFNPERLGRSRYVHW